MEEGKIRISINNILNFFCTVAIGIIFVCMFTSFWQYNGKIASIHDLIWLPQKSGELVSYLEERSGHALVFNEYGYGTVFLSAAGVIGGIICAFKILSDNNGIFYTVYGAAGIFTYLYIDFYRYGRTWKLQFILFCAIAGMGVIQILLRYAVKKDICFNGDYKTVSRLFITVLSLLLAAMFVTSALRGIKLEKQIIQNRETVNKVTAENTNFTAIKKIQLQIAENALDDEGAGNAAFLAERVNDGKIAVANKQKTLEALFIIKEKKLSEENKQQVNEALSQLEKAVMSELSAYMEKVRISVKEKPEYDPEEEQENDNSELSSTKDKQE